MTLKEIAKEAGVSISTVSRVINKNQPNAASKEVQDRIWDIVSRTGYVPNVNARNLKTGENDVMAPSKSIACLFARTSNAVNDLFFSTLARSLEKEAFKEGYVMKYTLTSYDFETLSSDVHGFEGKVDGISILGRCDKQLLKMLRKKFKYVVYAGLNVIEENCDQIVCDGYKAAVSAVEHLISLGHKRIGYIGEVFNEVRYLGYKDALRAGDIKMNNDRVSNVKVSTESGYEGAKRLMSRCPDTTGIFCMNDITALGAMQAIKEMNLVIPRDISVISIDDIELAQYFSPMLTTVHIPIEELGKMTAKILIDRINGGHSLPVKVDIPFCMAYRESCAHVEQHKEDVL